MKAIQVKYIGPTNTSGSKLKAFIDGTSISRGFDHAYTDGGAEQIAYELAKKLEWDVKLAEGTLPNQDKVFVIV